MSRVHDALRKAATDKTETPKPAVTRPIPAAETPEAVSEPISQEPPPVEIATAAGVVEQLGQTETQTPSVAAYAARDLEDLESIVHSCPAVPYTPAPDTLLMDPAKPKEAPSEEFRSLRTRLNHLQSTQSLHTLVISSASPGEGKSFTACNLAISQAQLTGKRILLADFDFRRPSISKLFGMPAVPGLTEYLRGKARIADILHHVSDSNLYVMTAGGMVTNPLELLNLPECNSLIEALRDHFDWVILDSPPLLFAADGNLLSTMADGTVLVVRIGATTYDTVTRAMQSLCHNNVLGIVVNGAHHGELYSRYSYYHSYYYSSDDKPPSAPDESLELEPAAKA